ncbi:MAG: hydantoinase/oxoprolinase family protein, partial [Betaproteobacteria bacterium]
TLAQAALGIYEVVNENMANAARVQAVERGHDPAGHALIAFGGAGPVHAWGVARKLGVSTIVIPPSPGVGSAFGLLLAPRALQLARTYIGTLDGLDWHRVQRIFDEMAEEARAALARAGVSAGAIRLTRRADMRYVGQRKEITVSFQGERFDGSRAKSLRSAFERRYKEIYHRRHDAHPVEVLCWRLAALGPETMSLPARAEATRRSVPTQRETRPMLFEGWSDFRDCPVFSRYSLKPGARIVGAAVIEEDESATVVGPGGQAEVDVFGNLLVTLPRRTR